MKSFCFFLLALILSVIVLIYVFNAGNESTLWWMMACGALFLLVAGILWIVTMFKENKEYQRTNKEYDQYEKEAEEALAAEIEAVKGNSLKKELVKRRLVRVYIEKNHPEASRHVDNSKFDGWYDCVSAFFCSGSVLFSPLLWGTWGSTINSSPLIRVRHSSIQNISIVLCCHQCRVCGCGCCNTCMETLLCCGVGGMHTCCDICNWHLHRRNR